MKSRRLEIRVESETRVAIRRRAATSLGFCQECGSPRLMLVPSSASQIAAIPTRVIYWMVQAGVLHFQDVDGELWICSESLQKTMGP